MASIVILKKIKLLINRKLSRMTTQPQMILRIVKINQILTMISAFTFISYGAACIFNGHMREEFKRYGLEKFRILTGALELFGGLGCLVGLYFDPIYYLSTFGLALLMLLGLLVRLRLKDSIFELLPAFMLMILNAYLFFSKFLSLY